MRIIALLISLALIAFLFYQYTNRSLAPVEGLNMDEGSTIIDTIDYAQEATDKAELEACLRMCAIDVDSLKSCQSDCNNKYNK